MNEPTTNQQQTQEQTCEKCGMPKSEWRGNDGQGCATDTGCTCD